MFGISDCAMDKDSHDSKRIKCWPIDSDGLTAALTKIIYPNKLNDDDSRELRRIIGLVHKHLGGVTVAVESDYIDTDYQSLFSMWYSKTFKPYSNLSNRIHFFACEVTDESLRRCDFDKSKYLGFCCLTPLMCGRVGRSVIRPCLRNEEVNGDLIYPEIMTAPSRAHVFGEEYKVYGFPFISQDAMVMVCAQSAIWMALLFLHTKYGRYGVRRNYPHEITEAAGRYLPWGGRILPAGGLTVQHMANALSNLGFTSILDLRQDESQDWNPQNWIVKYLDSEIPVILSTDKPPHAVVALGALHSQKMLSTVKADERLIAADAWVSGLIVNDDSLGPYRIMPLSEEFQAKFKGSAYENLVPDDDGWWHNLDNVDGVIVPLPQEVSIQARHVDDIVAEILANDDDNAILAYFLSEMDKGNATLDYILDVLTRPKVKDRLVTRAYLIRSMEFLKRVQKEGYPPAVREYYDGQRYPQYIWVVEVMILSEIDDKAPQERQICGEIVIDSTANHYSISLLSAHLCGVVVTRDVDAEITDKKVLGTIEPYASSRPPYLRSQETQ